MFFYYTLAGYGLFLMERIMQSYISIFDEQTRTTNPIVIGSGTYNEAYFFSKGLIHGESGESFPDMVMKIPKVVDLLAYLDINDSARQLKKWNMINHQYSNYARAQSGYRLYINHPFKDVSIIPGILYLSCLNGLYLKAMYMLGNGLVEHRLFINASDIITEIVSGSPTLSIENQNYIFSKLNLPRQSILTPYIRGQRSVPDLIIAREVLNIYIATRCIIVDACTNGNFLYNSATSKAICVDFDLAIHRDSPVSQEFSNYQSLLDCPYHNQYWHKCETLLSYAQTVMVIRALLYMEKFLSSDLISDEYLRIDYLSVIHDVYKSNHGLTVQLCIDLLDLLKEIKHSPNMIVTSQTLELLQKKLRMLMLSRAASSPGNDSTATNDSFTLYEDDEDDNFPIIVEYVDNDEEALISRSLSSNSLFSLATRSSSSIVNDTLEQAHQSSTETIHL